MVGLEVEVNRTPLGTPLDYAPVVLPPTHPCSLSGYALLCLAVPSVPCGMSKLCIHMFEKFSIAGMRIKIRTLNGKYKLAAAENGEIPMAHIVPQRPEYPLASKLPLANNSCTCFALI